MTRLIFSGFVIAASFAFADEAVCSSTKQSLPVERRLRQLTLDLLGRPPTLAEYRFYEAKGAVVEEDIRQMLTREEYFTKMKGYHRALLRANIVTSVYNNGDSRLTVSDGVYEMRGNPASPLRGQQGANGFCDHFIQQDNCNAISQDPQLEPAVKTCRDAKGVPMPVSVDYNINQYQCTALAAANCAEAISTGKLEAKFAFFCDHRRSGMNLVPYKCIPDPTKPQTAALTQEVLDGQNRVIAFVNPTPNASLQRLDKCTLDMPPLKDGIVGHYQPQAGCIQREGWVTTEAPFWVTDKPTVQMCAIQAMKNAVNPYTMESCETARYAGDRTCGCGEKSRRCESGDGAVHQQRVNAFNEEPIAIADSVLRRDEDYFNLLTTRRSFMNGPMSQLYRQKGGAMIWALSPPNQLDSLPDLSYDQKDKWVEYTRDEHASGVLTTAEWLYRFPTQRSRVNQFWNAFMCKHFSPPADAPVPSPEDACNRENNLSKRCGCSGCHATIEPTGAHWGRYGERNAQFLDPEVFPRLNTKCRDCALAANTTCDGECANYVMQAYDGNGAQSLGLLKTYLYRTDDEEPNIEGGPKLLVERVMQSGDLESCAVKNIWNELLGRPMTSTEQDLYLKPLIDSFATSGHNMKALMLSIVQTDAYRRID